MYVMYLTKIVLLWWTHFAYEIGSNRIWKSCSDVSLFMLLCQTANNLKPAVVEQPTVKVRLD